MKEYLIVLEGTKGFVMDARQLPKDEDLQKINEEPPVKIKESQMRWENYKVEIDNALYKNKNGYYIPSKWFSTPLIEGGKEISKGRGTYSKTFARKIEFLDEEIPFTFKKINNNGYDFAFYKTWVKSGNLRIRPLFLDWKLTLGFKLLEDLPDSTVKTVWSQAGLVGIGSARKFGYGKFKITALNLKKKS